MNKKGSTGWSITAIFVSVYCMLHVLALVKRQEQTTKNVISIISQRIALYFVIQTLKYYKTHIEL